MKTLGIDARLYFQTGVGTYLRNLLSRLTELNSGQIEYKLFVLQSDLPGINPARLPGEMVPTTVRWHGFAEQTVFMKELIDAKLDLVHFTYFSYPVLYPGPFLATIHDLTPLKFRTGKASSKHPVIYRAKHAIFSGVLCSQAMRAKAIITPTRSIKNQLQEVYGKGIGKKIFPIYEGINEDLIHATPTQPAHKPEKPYLLYVGNFYPHKNVSSLIEAFRNIQGDYQLILVGPADYFSREITRKIHSLRLESRIRMLHEVSSGELVWLYRNAHLFVHPSLAEGFGLPLVEAAYFGLPIVASDIPVFHELFGDAAFYFNPYRTQEMAQVITQVAGLRPKVDYRSSITRFSFQRMANEHALLYQRLLEI
ncbi:MAG: glycosyltransferase family 4 protein [Patescibacteria group bacterium]|nr:glycosyltransferase family 4 protein [Patescibacteria group bacterium]